MGLMYSFSWAHVLVGEPVSTSPEHALDAPVGRNLVVFVQAALAFAIAPVKLAAGAVGRGGAELLVGNVELVAFEFRIVPERIPRQRMILLPHAEEAAEPHHGVSDLAAHLVDHH